MHTCNTFLYPFTRLLWFAGVAASTKGNVQELQALLARQCSILQRLQQLEERRADASVLGSSEGAMWRPAPLHAHVRSLQSKSSVIMTPVWLLNHLALVAIPLPMELQA